MMLFASMAPLRICIKSTRNLIYRNKSSDRMRIRVIFKTILILFVSCDALPFWGSGKFHKTQPRKPRFYQDHCDVLYAVMKSNLPIHLRKAAVDTVGKQCVGKNLPKAPKINKSARHKLFNSYHKF